MEKKPNSPNFQEVALGKLGQSEKIGGAWRLRLGNITKRNGIDAAKVIAPEGECIRLRLANRIDWLRLERKVPVSELRSGYIRVLMQFKIEDPVPEDEVSIGVIGVYRYRNGRGEPHAVVKFVPQAYQEMSNVDRIIHIGDIDDEAEYRLCLSIRRSTNIDVYSLQLERSSQKDYYTGIVRDSIEERSRYLLGSTGTAPFRTLKLSVSGTLKALNDGMDKRLRSDPTKWLYEMLQVALRLEDYATAKGLAACLLATGTPFGNDIAKIVPLIVDTYVATGDIEALRDLCLKVSRYNGGKEVISKVLPLLEDCLDSNALSDSKELYYLNKRLGDTVRPVSLLDATNAMSGSPQDDLVAANYYRRVDPDLYSRHVREYFGSFDIPFLPIIRPYGENVLSNVVFEPRYGCAETVSEKLEYQPLVSIIIAAYNCESTIEYAIRSILNQSYKNIEVLVADDCSSDSTLEVIKGISRDPRIKVFRSVANQGPYNIRNSLIPKANGELIAFHDADDIAFPHRVDLQVSTMLQERTLVSLGRWIRVRPDGHFVAFRDNVFLRMCVNSIMFHRLVFDSFGPYRSTLFGADSEFYEKLRGILGSSKISQINVPGVLGLWSDSSLTRSPGIEANESGYRSEKRRCYAALANRQRVLGESIVPDSYINSILSDQAILREHSGIIEFSDLAEGV